MAATQYAVLQRVYGSSLANAYPQVGTNTNLDLIQIVTEGNNVVVNVDYQGTVHSPASSPTNGTRLGQFQTFLTSGTTAQYFASAFSNGAQQDILQNVNEGGSVTYYLSYAGVATGS